MRFALVILLGASSAGLAAESATPPAPAPAAVAAPAPATLDGHRLTMRDGRTLTGVWDADAGTLTLVGAVGAVLTIRADDVVASERVALPRVVEDAGTKRQRQLRAERTGTMAALFRLNEELGEDPEGQLASARRQLAALPDRITTERERATKLGDAADQYRRQVALVESTTKTTTTAEYGGDVPVVAVPGGAVTVPPAGAAVVSTSGGEVTTTTTRTVTADAARAELAKLEAEAVKQRATVGALEAQLADLTKREARLTALLVSRDRHQVRLAELEAMLQ